MGRIQIYDKLNNKLAQNSLSEADVVYILSRVRKILEIDKEKDSYSILNFYCNLALHAHINRIPKSVSNMLIKIKDNIDYSNSIIGFEDFHRDFIKFLNRKELSDLIYTSEFGVKNFNKLLLAIYSDTPIDLELKETYQVILDDRGVISFQAIS